MKIHDYTTPYWGHNYTVIERLDDGKILSLAGWGHGLSAGDYILFQNSKDTTMYGIIELKYETNPRDMWYATAVFTPRPSIVSKSHSYQDALNYISNGVKWGLIYRNAQTISNEHKKFNEIVAREFFHIADIEMGRLFDSVKFS
jgi:hypothetical protein